MPLRAQVAAFYCGPQHGDRERPTELGHVLRGLQVEGLVRVSVGALVDRGDVELGVD